MPDPRPRRSLPWGALAATALRTLTATVATLVVLMTLLGLTYAVPNDAIVRNVSRDIAAGRLAEVYPENPLGGRLDGYTQCLGVTSGVLPPGSTMSLPRRVAMVPRGPGECGAVAEDFALLASGDVANPEIGKAFGYIRYWSGYSIVSRPALALGGLRLAQAVAAVLLLGAAALLAHGVRRRAGTGAAVALVGTYLVASNALSTPLAFTQAIAEAAALAGAAAVLLVPRRWVVPAAASAAGVFVFVDLLTVPGTSWSLTTFAVALRAWSAWAQGPRTTRPARVVLLAAAGGAIAWCAGYGITWAARWVVATGYAGVQGVIDDVLTTARFRIDGDTTSTGVDVGVSAMPLASLGRNLGYWAMTLGLWAALAVLLAIAVVAVVRRGALREALMTRGGAGGVAALAAPALLVVLWYEFLRNHSQIHAFFTHRSLGAATAIVCAALVIGWVGAPRPARPGRPPREPLRQEAAGTRDASTHDAA